MFGLSVLVLAILAGCARLPATETGGVDHRQVEYAQIGHGAPVVVFENGLGASMASWKKVFAEIGKDTTVFAYNRPGYGNSDPASTPRDGAHIVDELRTTLRGKGLSPPYVLVGHSLGGLYMQLFARKYPDEVAGLVLVDSSHPTQFEAGGAVARQPWWVRMLFALFLSGEKKREFAAVRQTGEEVLRLPTFSGKPVIVLSAVDKRDSEVVHFTNKKRAELPRLYPGSHQSWVESGHFIQWDRPEVVIEAVRGILSQQVPPGTTNSQ